MRLLALLSILSSAMAAAQENTVGRFHIEDSVQNLARFSDLCCSIFLGENPPARDFCYVLAYSWTPEFCDEKKFPGCEKPRPYWKKNFTLHGLWPQFRDLGDYPSFCSQVPFDPSAVEKEGLSKMMTYWPNVKYPEGDPNYESFWEHEWLKHGTCTGLSPSEYLSAAVDLIVAYGSPTILSDSVGGHVEADALRNAMGGNSHVSLQCDGNKGDILSGAFTCWSQSGGLPVAQIICPSDVKREDTCAATSILIKDI